MLQLSDCIIHLRSYINLHQVVIRRVRQIATPVTELRAVVNLNDNSIRLRISQPHLWKLDEIKVMAAYYDLPEAVCERATESLESFERFTAQLTAAERGRLLRLCQLTNEKLSVRGRSGWSTNQIDLVVEGLSQWVNQRNEVFS